jgi:hypothetical protein
VPEERPVIAAVYYNRLRKGMLLQADPTIQYALGHHVGRVLYKDLAVQSPYNTYIHKGLPPGPVASPGVASLNAAANPANIPYLYFVASPDGHHEFRMTLDEHTNAVRQVRAESLATKTKVHMLASAAPVSTSLSATRTPVKATSHTASKTSGKGKATTRKSTKHTTSAKKKSSAHTTHITR